MTFNTESRAEGLASSSVACDLRGMRSRHVIWSLLPLALSAIACTPGIGITDGMGGSGGTTVTSAVTSQAGPTTGSSATQASVTAATTGVVGSASSVAASSSTGLPPTELQLYQHAYPFTTPGAVWIKSPISAVLGSDAPTQNIISALKLQEFDVLYLITSDQIVHYQHAGAWQTMPVDTMFPIPAGAKQDSTNPCTPTNPQGPPSVAVSSDPVRFQFQLPTDGIHCSSTSVGEQVTMLGQTYATVFGINQATFKGTYQVQRPYHTDCYMDAYPATAYASWGFNFANPADCGTSNPWFVTYGWYDDHYLRATGLSGPQLGPFSATDAANPIFKTPSPANQPNPESVLAAYFVQSASPENGTLVLIAP